ncbi:hypothetical protein V5799_012158 [Amblyomma americanum]|uniref:Peptidase S1 domain-containing protein n=1 Tax=Amblyomma americanum TaxID=6943 RepID=A0AAQ4EET4_AMBAM
MVQLIFGVNLLLCVLTTLLAQEDLEEFGFWAAKKYECGVSSSPKLIVNGSPARPGQFPWMVQLTVRFPRSPPSICGGSIITSRHILTAAHCVIKGGKKGRVQVRYGSIDRRRGKKVDVKKVKPHPSYKTRPLAYDIAVLTVKKPIKFSFQVRPVCLPETIMEVVTKDAVVSGWGVHKGRATIDNLRYTTLKVQPNGMCKSYKANFNPYTMLCAFKRGTGPCTGDSGGPLATKMNNGRFVQVGIVSMGGANNCGSQPNVYTRVDVLMPWIQEEINSPRFYEEISSDEVVIDLDDAIEPYSFWSDDVVYGPEYDY